MTRRFMPAPYSMSEYEALPRSRQLAYRILRHPCVLLGILPLVYFVVVERFWFHIDPRWRRERWSSLITTALAVALLYLVARWIGWQALLLIYLPTAMLAASAGMWLFLVQHHFPHAYFRPDRQWQFSDAAFLGSSYYELPAILNWFSADIGIHHLHHFDSRIPNYRLRECQRDNPDLQPAVRLSIRDSLACARLALWDEQHKCMIGFSPRRTAT